ncbi:hypothetical protein FQZ97_1122380 [compost metagenome]
MRRAMKRERHLPTVAWVIPSCLAITLFDSPSALLRMMRARVLCAAGRERLRTNDCSCERSPSLNTNSAFGLPVLIAVSPVSRHCDDKHN